MGKPKSIYKYTHDGEIGYMHYVDFEGSSVVLSNYDSLKTKYIIKNGFLEITTNLKDIQFDKVKCSIVTDTDYVQKVYDFMQDLENSYFKDGIDGLCAIVFEK